jgi:hypothetical protein
MIGMIIASLSLSLSLSLSNIGIGAPGGVRPITSCPPVSFLRKGTGFLLPLSASGFNP